MNNIQNRLQETIPYIRAGVRNVAMLPGENREDLVNSAILFSLEAIRRNEAKKRDVGPFAVAKWSIIRLKNGRRPYSAGETDVFDPRARLWGKTRTTGLDTPVNGDSDSLTLEEIIPQERDTFSDVADKMDEEEFRARLDHIQAFVLKKLELGTKKGEIADMLGISPAKLTTIIFEITQEADFWFDHESRRELAEPPQWKRCLVSEREQQVSKNLRKHEAIAKQNAMFAEQKRKSATETITKPSSEKAA